MHVRGSAGATRALNENPTSVTGRNAHGTAAARGRIERSLFTYGVEMPTRGISGVALAFLSQHDRAWEARRFLSVGRRRAC